MRALVTGGLGFLGSHVVDALLKEGHQVAVIDDLSGGSLDNVTNPQVRVYVGSILDTGLLDQVFDLCGFDYVFHLAAYAAEGLSHYIRRFNYTNNLIGSVNLINAAVRHNIKCFVFTSSIAVYGAGQTPFTEDMTPHPEDPYGIAKYAVELDLAAAHRQFNLPYIIFRPHNVYGERQNIADPYRNVIGIFMRQIMQDEPLTIFGDGLQTRAFTHVDDVAPIIARSVDVPAAYQRTFNIGADESYTVLRLAKAVGWAMGKRCKVEHLPERNEVKHAISDHRLVHEVFGTDVPMVSLEKGLFHMAMWARKQSLRPSRQFDALELDKGLPPSWSRARERALV